jgi:hypothetical protein
MAKASLPRMTGKNALPESKAFLLRPANKVSLAIFSARYEIG